LTTFSDVEARIEQVCQYYDYRIKNQEYPSGKYVKEYKELYESMYPALFEGEKKGASYTFLGNFYIKESLMHDYIDKSANSLSINDLMKFCIDKIQYSCCAQISVNWAFNNRYNVYQISQGTFTRKPNIIYTIKNFGK
jgi:hypothetical protein